MKFYHLYAFMSENSIIDDYNFMCYFFSEDVLEDGIVYMATDDIIRLIEPTGIFLSKN